MSGRRQRYLEGHRASLLVEQVLAPRFEFEPKDPGSDPTSDFSYVDLGV